MAVFRSVNDPPTLLPHDHRGEEPAVRFGGPWTKEKLDILEAYLDSFTTALKRRPFRLLYIDAFAGTGSIKTKVPLPGAEEFLTGSVERALRVSDKPFDRHIFIEKDPGRYAELARLDNLHLEQHIIVKNTDANDFLQNLEFDWNTWRGVLFLDPFATELEWATIERIAGFHALDTWILFPVHAAARILPRSRKPDDISPTWVKLLTRMFGDESWRKLYRKQPKLLGEPVDERERGSKELVEIYKGNLQKLFGDRFLTESKTLRTHNGAPLFEFLFCVGNNRPPAIKLAKRIAKHLLKEL